MIRIAWTNAVFRKTYELTLDDVADPRRLDILQSVFFDPEKLRLKEMRAAVTREAADKFSTIDAQSFSEAPRASRRWPVPCSREPASS